MSFAEKQRRARAEWAAWQQGNEPRILVGAASCGQTGAPAVTAALRDALARHKIKATVTPVGGLGLCYAEPMVGIIKPGHPRVTYGPVTPATAAALVEDWLVGDNPRPDLALGTSGEGSLAGIPPLAELPMLRPQRRVALRHGGLIDPESLNHYLAHGGYEGLGRALEMTPEAVVEAVRRAGLRGAGGAGYPAGQKWEIARRAPGGVKYIIANAHDTDPVAFAGRYLLESDPHAVLEGMLIGAYAVGAGEGYLYLHPEYRLAEARLRLALEQMAAAELGGERILGSDFSCRLHIVSGSPEAVCGEETALIASMEGRPAVPRPRPPYPDESGLWHRPTVVNSVETWSKVPAILAGGGQGYRDTKLCCLGGEVARCGLVEVPLGMPLRQIIDDIGGGMAVGRNLKAVQVGGFGGSCFPESQLDLPLDYPSFKEAGAMIGSGSIMVMAEDSCMVDVAARSLAATSAAACGKCAPGRLGTRQMRDIMLNITAGRGEPDDLATLEELGRVVRAASLCGLCAAGANPVLSTISHFRDEYEAHITEKRCPTGACRMLVTPAGGVAVT
ncbi:MAG: NADH-ubiquinone oxidoreductase-F iron-sulfur binding region domain-containing protein [Chloroflexota bacterium]